MARKRNIKERVDYRKGGRVVLSQGGQHKMIMGADGRPSGDWDPHRPGDQDGVHLNQDPGTPADAPNNPFPDTGNVPYGTVTDAEKALARKQIADAAAGTGVTGDAVIKAPTALKTAGMEDAWGTKVVAGGDAKAKGMGVSPREAVYQQRSAQLAKEQSGDPVTKASYQTVADKPVDVGSASIEDRVAQKVTELRDLHKSFVQQGMPSPAALAAAKAQLVSSTQRSESNAPVMQRLQEITVDQVEGPGTEGRAGQQVGVGELGDVLGLVTKEGTNLDALGTYQKAATRIAQTGDAASRIASELGTVPSEDADTRVGITSEGIAIGDAAQIGGVPTMAAATLQAVTSSEDRIAAAADMLSVVGEVPPEITAAISEDPAALEAELDTGADPNIVASVAALPQEALVSVQMENLLGSLDTGEIPTWAKPAVSIVNNLMADRGLDASTVGRTALFNAVIQSALPIAQANAQALQQRATQNLSNQQQASLAQSQQIMQVRMENLSNRNVAASQTAQMAQQIKVQQGTFKQQATITTAQQQQQTRTQELQGEQQRSAQRSAQSQQAAVATFSANIQKDLADLQYMNIAAKETMTAEQQDRLTEYNAKIAKVMRQADLDQEMLAAGITSDLQVELKNLTEQNATARASMSEENKMRLANLQVLVDFKKTNANLAQQMNLANMNNEQQMELAMLSDKAATDAANFTSENQFRLQELATTATVLSTNTELRARAELAQLSASEKVSLANLTARNQADSETMNAENVAELARYDKQMNAASLNANLAQQMGITQLSKDQERAMFNAQINAGFDMSKFSFEQQKSLADSKFMQTTQLQDFSQRHQGAMQDATATAALDLATADQRTKMAITNAQNFLQMDMKKLDVKQQEFVIEAQMRQQSLLSDQASFNASEQFNAASQNQLDQYMSGLGQQIEITNKQRNDAMQQFNATQQNAAQARRSGNIQQARLLTAQLQTDVSKFNDQQNYNREQFNATSANQIEQFNVNWRRDANKIDTAAINAVNQQNAMNAFGLSAQSMSFMWQELRDQMDYSFKTYDNDQQRKASLIVAALGNEAALDEDGGWANTYSGMGTLITNFLSNS